MSKRKMTLEEAKDVLDSDKVFYNGNRKFNVLDVGKYNSGITIEIPQEWTVSKRRKPENPIKYITLNELTDGMNIDFDGAASVLLGKYRLSKNGRPVFELTKPTEAKDVLVRVGWGGAFNKTRGQSSGYAKAVGASFFTRRSSNGGGYGNDYWILPVNFVNDMEPRDVSEIMKRVEKEEAERIAEIDSYIEREDREINASIENRDRVLEAINPIISSIEAINEDFQYTIYDDKFEYRDMAYAGYEEHRYTDELINKLEESLERAKQEKEARETYKPLFQEMEDIVKGLELNIEYEKKFVSLRYPVSREHYGTYNYSQEGYNQFTNDMKKRQEARERAKEEARMKAVELRKAAELKKKKEEAKEMGYPEKFEFWNRLGGATNLSHAYVIESDGTIREPDYNDLRNHNHKCGNPNWINNADGTQGYEQILPGEVIISYVKNYSKVPYSFGVEWADGELTEEQLEVICDLLDEKQYFAVDEKGKEITDLGQWVTETVKAKAMECREKLNIKEQEQEDFAEKVVDLAEEKAETRKKDDEAKELMQAYSKLQEQSNKGVISNDE